MGPNYTQELGITWKMYIRYTNNQVEISWFSVVLAYFNGLESQVQKQTWILHKKPIKANLLRERVADKTGESAAQMMKALGTGHFESYLQGQRLPSHVL